MGAKVSEVEFLAKAKALHPTLDFSKTQYLGSAKPVTFTCPEHGEQTARANNVLLGRGCPLCGRKRAIDAGVAAMHAALAPEDRAESARRASASRTTETFEKIAESQRRRWAAADDADRQAQAERSKKTATEMWANTTPEQRKEKMAAVRAAKKLQQ